MIFVFGIFTTKALYGLGYLRQAPPPSYSGQGNFLPISTNSSTFCLHKDLNLSQVGETTQGGGEGGGGEFTLHTNIAFVVLKKGKFQ